jgi:hypothetical protein
MTRTSMTPIGEAGECMSQAPSEVLGLFGEEQRFPVSRRRDKPSSYGRPSQSGGERMSEVQP